MNMKKLGKIKLNQLNQSELEKRKMGALKGGCACAGRCGCSCVYVGDNSAYWGSKNTSSEQYTY